MSRSSVARLRGGVSEATNAAGASLRREGHRAGRLVRRPRGIGALARSAAIAHAVAVAVVHCFPSIQAAAASRPGSTAPWIGGPLGAGAIVCDFGAASRRPPSRWPRLSTGSAQWLDSHQASCMSGRTHRACATRRLLAAGDCLLQARHKTPRPLRRSLARSQRRGETLQAHLSRPRATWCDRPIPRALRPQHRRAPPAPAP
jgi:hypothetical protein